MDDTISRQAVLTEIGSMPIITDENGEKLIDKTCLRIKIKAIPPAQPNLSEAYNKAVFTWLMDYQIRAAELNGRYTPYEVLSWVVNDWRKEHERSD